MFHAAAIGAGPGRRIAKRTRASVLHALGASYRSRKPHPTATTRTPPPPPCNVALSPSAALRAPISMLRLPGLRLPIPGLTSFSLLTRASCCLPRSPRVCGQWPLRSGLDQPSPLQPAGSRSFRPSTLPCAVTCRLTTYALAEPDPDTSPESSANEAWVGLSDTYPFFEQFVHTTVYKLRLSAIYTLTYIWAEDGGGERGGQVRW
ncbi:hypothetical protein BC628DRAFT_441786 [Trametes gibbosa]|nr:hypothetical protein BC628DRAFT_441786 [Trametes gibbosa]